ncbi:toll-like receptor 4 [Saccostrea cucullata]|uniref:toll-like receptor 4 n=1 Tax=Saccostrea cuccullata TaxID=36930 RepID=UPI002ED2FFA8
MGPGLRTLSVLSALMLIENVYCCASQPRCRCYMNHTHADCSNLGLKSSPYFWSNVTHINLSNNMLTQLPERNMIPDDVTYLDLSNNSIKTFRNNSFEGLRKLSILKLNLNKFKIIENLNQSLFADLINIKNLDISDNNELTFRILPILIYGIQNSTISSLRLNKIHCTFGLSTEIRVEDIQYLIHTSLTELHISSNKIELIENGATKYIPKTLRRLSIADNRLTVGLYILQFDILKGLEWLNVSSQHFTHDPIEFIHDVASECEDEREPLTSASTHTDSHILKQKKTNSVNKLKVDMKRTDVDLKGSQVFLHFSGKVGFPVPPNVKKVFFNESGLRYRVPKIHSSKNSVEEIYLQDNTLYSWMGPIRGVNNLKIMNLSNNFCSSVSKYFFKYLGSLTKLYLNDNLLGFSLSPDTEGEIFAGLKNLIRLELRANRITHLPNQVFKGLRNIKDLVLADNTLSSINFKISTLKNLKFLDLSGNQIQFLSDTNMKDIDRQTDKVRFTLNLLRNPISCNCKTLSFLQWMVNSQETQRISFE